MAKAIVAIAVNGLIGNRPDPLSPGRTPWQGQLPADMTYFMDQTMGKVVVMGKATYLSIPERFRPLRGRVNAVLTNDPTFAEAGVTPVRSLDAVFSNYKSDEIYFAGGGQVFREALLRPEVDTVLLTRVDGEFEGNIYFPELDLEAWRLTNSDPHPADEKNHFGYRFDTYEWAIESVNDISVVDYPNRIVDPRNARSRAYLLELLELQRLGQCPFCTGGKTLREDPIVDQNDYCWLKVSHTPLPNTDHHLVIAPMRHCLSANELTTPERYEMNEMLYRYLSQNNLAYTGIHLMREGNTEDTGATVCHIHENYLIPTPGKTVSVNFGQWKGQPGWIKR